MLVVTIGTDNSVRSTEITEFKLVDNTYFSRMRTTCSKALTGDSSRQECRERKAFGWPLAETIKDQSVGRVEVSICCVEFRAPESHSRWRYHDQNEGEHSRGWHS